MTLFKQNKEKSADNKLDKAPRILEPEKLKSLYKRHKRVALNRVGATAIMWIALLFALLIDIIEFRTFLYTTFCAIFLILINIPTLLVFKRIKNRQAHELFSLSVNFLEIVGYTAAIYFLGGIMAAFLLLVYSDIIAYAGMVAPGRTPFIMATLSTLSFTAMVLSVHFGIIPYQKVVFPEVTYNLKEQLVIILVGAILLYIIAFISSRTSVVIKQSKEKLAESESRYREHVENIGDIVYVLDRNGRIKYVNKALEKLLGVSLNNLRKRKLKEIVTPQTYEELQDIIKKRKDVMDGKAFEITILCQDGLERTYEIRERVLMTNTKITEIHGIGRDVTERKKMEEQVIQSQRMEAVGALAGGIAHNFNNILVGIMGYSEYLVSKKGLDDPDYKALETIHKGTIRASELTYQLLHVARGGEYKRTELNLNDVVESVHTLISGSFFSSIEINTYLASDLMVMEGDIGQLEQCLLNLCINSRDAMPKGGNLIIETKNQKLDQDFVETHFGAHEGDHVVLSVTDTGIGMTEEVKEHIFEPFFSTKDQKRSTGMGLSTVYGIVKNHGGMITVYSEVGEGTTFKLYFPVAGKHKNETPSIGEDKKLKLNTTILIIDDEPIVTETWKYFLSAQGYSVITANDRKEGLEIFQNKVGEIDLIILDYVMPNIGGKQTVTHLKEIDPNVKILLSSGYSENTKIKEIIAENADGFIQKPSPLSELNRKIIEILVKE